MDGRRRRFGEALGATVRYEAQQQRVYFIAVDGEENLLTVDTATC
jgi:hypothetical protein